MLFVINLPPLQWLLEETTFFFDLLISADFLCCINEKVSPSKTLNMEENILKNETFVKVSQALPVWEQAKVMLQFCLFVLNPTWSMS